MKHLHIFSRNILKALPAVAQDVLLRIERQAFMVALYSGTCLGLALHAVGYYFLAGFLPIASIVYFIFEPLVLTPTKRPSKSRGIIRAVFAVILTALSTTGIEIYFFKKSISNHFIEKNNEELIAIDDRYANEIIGPLSNQIAAYEADNARINALIQKRSDEAFKELDQGGKDRKSGPGIVYKNILKLKKSDSLRYAPQLADNKTKIAELQATIDHVHTERLAERDQVIDPSKRGFLDRIKALHELLFQDGNYLMQGFYVVFFLFSLCIELSTLYAKWNHKPTFDAYLHEQNRQDEDNQYKNTLTSKYNKQQIKEQLEQEKEKTDLENKLKHEQDMAETKMKNKWILKEIVLRWLRKDSDNEDQLSEEQRKRLKRKSIKSHLNGTSENHIEKPEEQLK